MKRTQLQALILLAITATGVSWLFPIYKMGCCENPVPVLYGRGFPLPYYLYQTIWNPRVYPLKTNQRKLLQIGAILILVIFLILYFVFPKKTPEIQLKNNTVYIENSIV